MGIRYLRGITEGNAAYKRRMAKRHNEAYEEKNRKRLEEKKSQANSKANRLRSRIMLAGLAVMLRR